MLLSAVATEVRVFTKMRPKCDARSKKSIEPSRPWMLTRGCSGDMAMGGEGRGTDQQW
ncbi:hypothetical protein AAW51_0882 [Caldimonas brevitalea]|uniref:Uncharacterized protein n=1 Tax=Caldimonas brevitalea TaxID=413882 RepID=A0A0G3BHW1_9BURK|nr:hypothetical protein AAW51_0882 [Caldimonas brevitalea]